MHCERMIAFYPLEGPEQMPPKIEENSRYLYLSSIFCFIFKVYIYIYKYI